VWGIVAMTVLHLNCPGCLKIESELGVREEFLAAPKDSPGDDSKEKPRPAGEPGGAFMSGRSGGAAPGHGRMPLRASRYSTTCTMRRVRGSTNTVRPFTTV
jgi:hypothetical protein